MDILNIKIFNYTELSDEQKHQVSQFLKNFCGEMKFVPNLNSNIYLKNFVAVNFSEMHGIVNLLTLHEMFYGGFEIHNVCTRNEFRGKGITRNFIEKVINSIKEIVNHPKIWLAAKIGGKLRAARLYASLGFKDIRLSTISPGCENYKKYILSMYYGTNTNNISKLEELSHLGDYLNNNKTYKFTNTFQPTYNYIINSPVEIGFTLNVGPFKDGLVLDDIQYGTEANVNTPKSIINGHTHPISTMQNYFLFLGWPSSLDFGYVMYNDVDIHCVFTYRGMYEIKTTLECKILSRLLEIYNLKEKAYDAIVKKIASYEEFRDIGQVDPELAQVLRYLITNCGEIGEVNKIIKPLIFKGCKSKNSIELLKDSYVNEFVRIVNNLTIREFGIDMSTLQFEILNKYNITYNSTLFCVRFYKF